MARDLKVSPFEIMEQDTDDVILIVNYYLAKNEEKPQAEETPQKKDDGFWDF